MDKGFYFYANPFRPRSVEAARQFFACLHKRGAKVWSPEWLAREGVGTAGEPEDHPEKIRAVIALGGDGTLLRIAPRAARLGIPLLGMHAGTVGFLMRGDPDRAEELAALLMQAEYPVSAHPLMKIQTEDNEYLALNDVSLTRGEHPGIIETAVYADGEWVFSPHGDGVVVSTPLGATAYAMAAGGPIPRPDVDCLLVVPLCARELLQRPVILPGNSQITLRCQGTERRRLQLSLDGQTLIPLIRETEIRITRSRETALLIQPDPPRFFTTLRQKQQQWNALQTKEQE